MESLDCVEEVYFHSLAGAYSPSFIPSIPNGIPFYDCTTSYEDVMIVGQVTELSPIQDYDIIFDRDEGFVGVYGVLKIEEVILKNDDYGRYLNVMDEYLNFTVNLARREDTDYIQNGERYVFFGAYDRSPNGLYLDDGVSVTPIHPWISANADCCLEPEGLMRIDYYDLANRYGDGAYDAPKVYGAPFMKRVDGTFEEFLADPENALFVTVMEQWDRQQHSLPVFGTENLNATHLFVSNTANIVAGRSISDEEYASGARVCVLSGLRMETDAMVLHFANLLDNAIEASQRIDGERSIRCSIIAEEGLYLSVKNTSPPVIIRDSLIPTAKHPPEEHGYGLMSI